MSERREDDWWALWSLPRRWQKVYSDVFTVLFVAGVGYTLVYEGCLDRSTDSAAKTALDVVQGTAPVGIASASLALVGTGVSMAIAEWIGRRKFAAGKAEGIAAGRVEGIAEGRVEGRVEGKAEGRAEVIQALKALGHEQAVAALTEAESNGSTLTEPSPGNEEA